MKAKLFYRVGKEDNSGMWYNQNGEFLGLIHKPEFNKLTCHQVQMPFDKSIVGWLSATETLEELKKWFSDSDMEILKPLGYKVLIYQAIDYKIHSNHWVINQQTSILT